MSEKNWFQDWFNSPYYHMLYEHRDEVEAKTFISHLINYLKPQADAKMLDVACGKGRHSKTLADLGYDVTGIDLSEASIASAQKFAHDKLQFFVHDMRLPFFINYFDYAFNFFTSFGYFKTKREHDAAIRTIAQSLKPNGYFIIDYLNVHYEEDRLVPKTEKHTPYAEFIITKWHTDTHFYKQIQLVDDQKNLRHLNTEKVAKFSLGDFTEMLAYQEIQIKEVFGSYQFERYDIKKSPRLIMIAQKIEKK